MAWNMRWMWWCGQYDKRVVWKEVVEVRMVSDRVTVDVLVFEEDVLRLICGHARQSGKLQEKQTLL